MPNAARKPASRTSAAPVPRVQVGPLIINIGHQGTGCVYRLDPLSKRRVTAAHPRTHVVPTVVIGYVTRDDYEEVQGPMWPQIARMLTGLSRTQLRAFGGVELYDWEEDWRRRIV